MQKEIKQKFMNGGVSESTASFLSETSFGMDEKNLKMLKVWANAVEENGQESGMKEVVKQMFVDPEDGSQLSYAESRSLYG